MAVDANVDGNVDANIDANVDGPGQSAFLDPKKNLAHGPSAAKISV